MRLLANSVIQSKKRKTKAESNNDSAFFVFR
jgi:hypothetical protein